MAKILVFTTIILQLIEFVWDTAIISPHFLLHVRSPDGSTKMLATWFVLCLLLVQKLLTLHNWVLLPIDKILMSIGHLDHVLLMFTARWSCKH